MQAQLIPVDGGPSINIVRDVTLVGRKAGLCDIVLEHGSVSKLQCLIIRTDGLLFIRDLGSTNGTKVNGQRVTRGALLPGDELSFASVVFRVHLGPGEPQYGTEEKTEFLSALPELPDRTDQRSDRDSVPLLLEEPLPAEMGSDSDVRLLSEDSAG